MTLDSHTCYRALKARDARFDGRFFVAVSSTRIYCRPVCTVKPPKRENCRFYPSAAAAETDGYRPCLRCRPELAPGNASVDATSRLAQAAASLMEDRALDEAGLDTVAAQLGITDRHLRRAFGAEFGVSPVQFAQTQRLLLAKRLLTDTVLPVTEVAFASGFGSVRRFNALFKQRYRLQSGATAAPCVRVRRGRRAEIRTEFPAALRLARGERVSRRAHDCRRRKRGGRLLSPHRAHRVREARSIAAGSRFRCRRKSRRCASRCRRRSPRPCRRCCRASRR